MKLKFISWNVNGLRAVTGKNFYEDFKKLDADFFCIQETKLQEGQIQMELPGYYEYWNYAQKKGVLVCGDLNVAHNEIDIKNPAANRRNAGFTDEERSKMTQLLQSGFIDTFRYFYPDKAQIYSWWSYRFSARQKNAGWRIDYFLASNNLKEKLISADIHTQIFGSDHCPVELIADVEV